MHIADKQTLMQFRPCCPELTRRQFEHESILEPGQIRLSEKNRGHLIAQPIGRIPVVVVPVRDDFSLGMLAGKISFSSDRRAPRDAKLRAGG